MTITLFFRQKGAGFSIEGIFKLLAAQLRHRYAATVSETHVPNMAIRPLSVWRNLRFAYGQKAAIYHITGDIHYVALVLPANRTVLTIHDCVSLNREQQQRNWLRFCTLWFLFYYLPVRRIAHITTVSEKSRQELIRYLGPMATRIQVIANPYNPCFQPVPKKFNQTKPIILQIGTATHKNLYRLISALTSIPCQLVIIGALTIAQRRQLIDSAIDYRNRESISEADMLAEYIACDLVSFVSTYEGFGMPILEANAVGRVVLTANIAPMRTVAGEAALLVDPLSIEAIRAGVCQLISDSALRRRLIEAGIDNVKKYEVDEIAKQYMAIYQEIGSH